LKGYLQQLKRSHHLIGVLRPLAFFVAVTLFVIPLAHADIYVYLDSAGVMHFTNTPTSSNYKVYMSEKRVRPAAWYGVKSYDDVISEAGQRFGLSSSLLKALIHVESYFDPRAVSKKGAIGLMQIMPQNLQTLEIVDPYDPWENIMGGARYLKRMLERFGGDLPLALAAYNAGPTAVEKYQDIPPYPETQAYVKKVIEFFRLYKQS
jgi:soluble lytic murein transglycosylase-like protein